MVIVTVYFIAQPGFLAWHHGIDDDDDFSLLFALKGHVEPTGTPVGFRVPSS